MWALTPKGTQTESVDGRQIAREFALQWQAARAESGAAGASRVTDDTEPPATWQDKLLSILQAMDPTAFERLCQRILRESGFIEVEVTKRSGDGGIDGHGTIRLGGLISFNVLFQSKRYKGNIGPDTVRDFRGAMVGRADKGVLISTGGFTLEARREATRDGAPPIDLIDGRLLAEKLKELKLGVFSGRPARGLANTFIARLEGREDMILPYPLQNVLTRAMRTAAAKRADSGFLSLWAGRGATRARVMPAGELVKRLVDEMNEVGH